MRRSTFLAVTSLAVLPAAALAQDPGTTTPTPPPTTPPPPAAAAMALQLQHVGAPQRVVLGGKQWLVKGTVTPFVKGQQVRVRFYRGAKQVKSKLVGVHQHGKVGTFVVHFRTLRPGRYHVRALKPKTDTQLAAQARTPAVTVLRRHLSVGMHNDSVRILQHRLWKLRYVVGRRGVYDARTARGVLAYRKHLGLAREYSVDQHVWSKLLAGKGAWHVHEPHHGHHVEADLSEGVLALIVGNRVDRIYATSPGKPSTPTVLGHFRVYRKTPGRLPDGMYYSSFFIRGYAVHGYPDVPTYNASHGCLRVNEADAITIYNWIRLGDRVDVYA